MTVGSEFAGLARTVARTHAIRFQGHEPHRHPEPHLVYVVKGTGRLTVDGRLIVLDAGRAAWLPGDIQHELVLSADGIAIGPILSPHVVPPDGRTLVLGPLPALSDLVTVLLCAAPEVDEERVPLRAALEELLLATSHDHFPLRLPEHPVARAIAAEAAGFPGSLEALAERHFVSARHVQRLFLEETGLTFATWRTRARLNLAVARLRDGDGMRAALRASGFATRQGLRKALARESGTPVDDLLL